MNEIKKELNDSAQTERRGVRGNQFSENGLNRKCNKELEWEMMVALSQSWMEGGGCLVMALWVSLLGFLIYSAYLFVIGGNWLEPLKDVGIGLIVLITPFIVGSLIN